VKANRGGEKSGGENPRSPTGEKKVTKKLREHVGQVKAPTTDVKKVAGSELRQPIRCPSREENDAIEKGRGQIARKRFVTGGKEQGRTQKNRERASLTNPKQGDGHNAQHKETYRTTQEVGWGKTSGGRKKREREGIRRRRGVRDRRGKKGGTKEGLVTDGGGKRKNSLLVEVGRGSDITVLREVMKGNSRIH